MKALRLLLLILAFVLHHSVVAAQSVHGCCMEAECPVTACADMGCMPAPLPPLADGPAAPAAAPSSARDQCAPAPRAHLSDRFDNIWRPPE